MLIDQIAIASINSYQSHLSPHKGFACPFRLAYGADSCSQFLKVRIAKVGLRQALREWRIRLQDCASAGQVLQSSGSPRRGKGSGKGRRENYTIKACGESDNPSCDRCYWTCEAISCLGFVLDFLK